MSKIKDELIGAENAVRDVADKAMMRVDNVEAIRLSFPALDKQLGSRKNRFAQAVKHLLEEMKHPEVNNAFIGQVAYTWLVDEGRRAEDIEPQAIDDYYMSIEEMPDEV